MSFTAVIQAGDTLMSFSETITKALYDWCVCLWSLCVCVCVCVYIYVCLCMGVSILYNVKTIRILTISLVVEQRWLPSAIQSCIHDIMIC